MMYSVLNIKVLFAVIFPCICCFVFAVNTCNVKYFAISSLYTNLKPEDSPIKEINDSNGIDCATRCYRKDRCTGFSISSVDGVCSMYGRRYQTMTYVQQSGTRSYERISVDPSDCYDVLVKGLQSKGVYTVLPRDNGAPINVSCEDSSTDGGGWLVIQRRTNGSEDFFRIWNEYKDGFGDLNNEFWLGNKNIHRITSQGYYDLKIDLEDFEGNRRYALYKNFSVSSEDDFFKLSVGAYRGNAGDGLTNHNGCRFSAKDKEFDRNTKVNCAERYKGAWWYNACHKSNLNGLYLGGANSTFAVGVTWEYWLGQAYSLKKTVMKIRPMKF